MDLQDGFKSFEQAANVLHLDRQKKLQFFYHKLANEKTKKRAKSATWNVSERIAGEWSKSFCGFWRKNV